MATASPDTTTTTTKKSALQQEQSTAGHRKRDTPKRVAQNIARSEAKLARFDRIIKKDGLPPMVLTPAEEKEAADGKTISRESLITLKELFLMDGITYTQAAMMAGCNPKTARDKFLIWAEALVEDEKYETWVERQHRVRARALEGITKQMIKTDEHLATICLLYTSPSPRD